MKNRLLGFACATAILPGTVLLAQSQKAGMLINENISSLVSTYKMLHAAPELSHYEVRTSAFVAKELIADGYEVTERVGKYPPAGNGIRWQGYGVVAVMKNGAGPTVLVRSELDALPVEEKTGLPYASRVRAKNDAGQEVGVTHACGHDIHITSLLGTAKILAALRDQWHGTLVLIFQPAEETIDGARAMLADGLYTRFPKPDECLALHDSADLEAGKVGYTPGYALASSDSVDVTIRGKGGHGSRPEITKDPVVAAAEFIMDLQTLVSRENSPFDPAVVTVGSIQGGTRYNIIPDDVHLQLTVRAYRKEVRDRLLASIPRIADGVAAANGIPADRAPIVEASKTETTPATYNDPALSERLAAVFRKTLGADNVVEMKPIMASEDFGLLGLDHQIPIFMFSLGAVDPAKLREARQTGALLPGLHSSGWAPLPEPTIRTGVTAMTAAVISLMQ